MLSYALQVILKSLIMCADSEICIIDQLTEIEQKLDSFEIVVCGVINSLSVITDKAQITGI